MRTVIDVLDWVQQTQTLGNEAVITPELERLQDQILSELPPPGHSLWSTYRTALEAREKQIRQDPKAGSNLRFWSILITTLAWKALGNAEYYVEELSDALIFAASTTNSNTLHGIYDEVVPVLQAALDEARNQS